METELSKAIDVLCKALSEDKSEGSYYHSWQANIAIQFQDEWKRKQESAESIGVKLNPFDPVIHRVANNAAKNFLDLLIATTLDKESLNHEDDLTPYELSQLEKYGNIIPETEPEEPYEENR